jgi:hypothetical protein
LGFERITLWQIVNRKTVNKLRKLKIENFLLDQQPFTDLLYLRDTNDVRTHFHEKSIKPENNNKTIFDNSIFKESFNHLENNEK